MQKSRQALSGIVRLFALTSFIAGLGLIELKNYPEIFNLLLVFSTCSFCCLCDSDSIKSIKRTKSDQFKSKQDVECLVVD